MASKSISRWLSSRSCINGTITIEDFSQSIAYQENFGLGEARGKAEAEAIVI
jgi:hypothetical protein